jgi:hypothetical protein
MKEITNCFREVGFENVSDSVEGITEVMNKIDEEEVFEKLANSLSEIIAKLCQDRPSLETLEKLPYRPFMAFFGFLLGEVMSPEASKPDSSNIRTLRRSG